MMTKKSFRSHQIMNSTHMLGMMKAAAKAEAIPEPLRTQGDRDIITANAREKAILAAEMSEVAPVEVTEVGVKSKTPKAKKHPAVKKPAPIKKTKHGKK